MIPTNVDRRTGSREPLFMARRRYPRLALNCDLFYESEEACLFSPRVDLSLRGIFVPCRFPDREGTRGTVRLDVGAGPMLRAEVEVLRNPQIGRRGMALRFVAMSDGDRLRLGAFLLQKGGLKVLPQLDRRFRTLTRAPRPLGALARAA